MSFLLEKNLYIFVLSSLLIVVSIFGNHETPIKQLFYDFEFFKIINILLLNNDIFRPPDTSLRFSIFIISFGLLLSSFFIESRSNINSSKIFSQFIIFLVSIFFMNGFLFSQRKHHLPAIKLSSYTNKTQSASKIWLYDQGRNFYV